MISSDIGKEAIKKELPLIPKLPGVYRMLNEKNVILYVGKAKNLPNRLKSYVSEKNHIIRTERMLSQTRKIEITSTSNESEALLLEANSIYFYAMTNHFRLFLLEMRINGLKLEDIEEKKLERVFTLDHLLQLDLQIGLLK